MWDFTGQTAKRVSQTNLICTIISGALRTLKAALSILNITRLQYYHTNMRAYTNYYYLLTRVYVIVICVHIHRL